MAQTLATPIAPSLSLICNRNPNSKFHHNALSFPTSIPPMIGGLSIKCARVGGVEIPNNKRVEYSLQYIHGIGRTRAKQILCDLNMENKVTKDMSEDELITLRDEVSKYMIEGDLACASEILALILGWTSATFLVADEIMNIPGPTRSFIFSSMLGVGKPVQWSDSFDILTCHFCRLCQASCKGFNALAIRRLKEIQCYRGVRHIQGLPCRGQRTKNNCRTLKGKRVAIAGKKKAPR
ncbi:unnamed protein product [Ilex paraguariensis]|uniref:Ribosomal protein S13 n=1 Tax=Ilex paraguariensis TaxID=185542 RepID=A0ABC8TJK2_9AQUA